MDSGLLLKKVEMKIKFLSNFQKECSLKDCQILKIAFAIAFIFFTVALSVGIATQDTGLIFIGASNLIFFSGLAIIKYWC